jgi:hypothetical protein
MGSLKDESIHSSPEDFDALLLASEPHEKEQERMGEFSRYFEFSELGNVKLTERFLPKDGDSVITPELMNALPALAFALHGLGLILFLIFSDRIS